MPNQKPKTETKKTAVPANTDNCNMVFIAGKVHSSRIREKSGWTLVTVDEDKGRSVPVTTFEKKLLKDLENFQDGDFIRFVGYLSQTKDRESGQYKLLVVATALKCEIPRHAQSRQGSLSDEIPF